MADKKDVLAQFTNASKTGLGEPFKARVRVLGQEWSITVASCGHTLAARVEGEGAGRLSLTELAQVVSTRPENEHEMLAAQRPTYWVALGQSRSEPEARGVGLDALYVARVATLQTDLHRAAKAVCSARAKSTTVRAERDLWLDRSRSERLALAQWQIAGRLDPVYVRVATIDRMQHESIGSHVAYFVVIMPWAL